MTTPTTDSRSPGESSFCHPWIHETFDIDLLLRSLAHPCRREVLCLLDAQPSWSRRELAANLGTVDPVATPMSDQQADVVLVHWHLPLLDDARLIQADDGFDRIERGEDFLRVRDMVDAAVSMIA